MALQRAVAPDGTPISGTVERIAGTALIDEFSWSRNEDGTLSFEHSGYTEVNWDSETTMTRKGRPIYEDEEGRRWPESAIRLVDVDAEDDPDA